MIEHAGWLVLWGTFVGLDLISAGQVMIARPLVAGTVAGFIVGDPAAGAAVGVILELFALDVLPVGASRYPDYGLGAVAATATAAGAPWLGVGLGVGVGLLVAHGSGIGIHFVRLRNGSDVEQWAPALEAGDSRVLTALQARALGRDFVRTLSVSVLGVLLAVAVHRWFPLSARGASLLAVVAVGAGVSGAVNGAIRMTAAERWFVMGLVGGIAVVAFG